MAVRFWLRAAVAVSGVVFSVPCQGQESDVVRTSHAIPTPLPPVDSSEQGVQFQQLPAELGDRVAQDLKVNLQLDTTLSQKGEIAHQTKISQGRQQQRFVEVVQVSEGRVTRAHVRFPRSREHVAEGAASPTENVHPIEGKNYFVARKGGQLFVTDSEHAIPPKEEFLLVADSMHSLGKPNMLAKFLLEQGTIAIGEQLDLPRAIAEELMGLAEGMGTVETFRLKLVETREFDGQPCAVFAATIRAQGDPSTPLQLNAQGEVIIQLNTTRTVLASFEGPLTMDAEQPTPEGKIRYEATGAMQVAIHSKYGQAPE